MSGVPDPPPEPEPPGPPADPAAGGPEPGLVYVPNPKHREPWQRGRRGSLCPKEISPAQAQQLLDQSVPDGEKRYAVHEGRPYCGQSDGAGGWHGYPVGWKEVPSKLRTRWQNEQRVRKRDIDRYWDG